VLRLNPGEKAVLFDEKAREYDAILQGSSHEVIFSVKERAAKIEPGKTNLTIACALPKKSKFDDIVDKLTQLGVNAIVPLITERVVVKLEKANTEAKLLRWQKIAKSACEQSQRITPPAISAPVNFKDFLKRACPVDAKRLYGEREFDLKLIPTLEGKRNKLKELKLGTAANILVLIGPEGDFAPSEVSLAVKHGFIPVSLGSNVLRVDTACVAVASFIKLSTG
jgi:16S rRNA (uracil1498-N3)-methyltransferase